MKVLKELSSDILPKEITQTGRNDVIKSTQKSLLKSLTENAVDDRTKKVQSEQININKGVKGSDFEILRQSLNKYKTLTITDCTEKTVKKLPQGDVIFHF